MVVRGCKVKTYPIKTPTIQPALFANKQKTLSRNIDVLHNIPVSAPRTPLFSGNTAITPNPITARQISPVPLLLHDTTALPIMRPGAAKAPPAAGFSAVFPCLIMQDALPLGLMGNRHCHHPQPYGMLVAKLAYKRWKMGFRKAQNSLILQNGTGLYTGYQRYGYWGIRNWVLGYWYFFMADAHLVNLVL